MRRIKNLFNAKKMVRQIQRDFKEPETIIDMLLILLYIDGILDEKDIELIELFILNRCNISEIIKLPTESIQAEIQKLEKINIEKCKELGEKLDEK